MTEYAEVARAEADGRERVEEIATEPVTIASDAPLAEAARAMAEGRVSHLIAIQPGTDRPVGVVSASGLTAVLASDEGKDIAQGFQVDVEGEGRDEGQDH